MIREKFIKELEWKNYDYEIDGDRIIITSNNSNVDISLAEIPSGVVFSCRWAVYLNSLVTLPDDVEFRNGEHVYLNGLISLPPRVVFKNEGKIDLNSLTDISPGVKFENRGSVDLESLKIIPPGVEFHNWGSVYLDSLLKGWISQRAWSGNLRSISSNRLLNLMIERELFI